MPDITNVVNTILANGSTELQNRVPAATIDNIQAVGNPILTYQSVQNEFLSALVNKVAMQMVNARIFNNPLAVLKKGTIPLGLDVENSFVNPATDAGYDKTGATLLATSTPDVKAEYFRMNRQAQYPVTIYREQLKQAFTSWDALGKLIEGITNSLYSGDFIDEFILMKDTIGRAAMNQKMITASVSAVTDEASAKAFVKAVKNLSSGFLYPSTAFNAYSKAGGSGNAVQTWTPQESQLLIIRSDIMNSIDVDVLAAAFNLGKAEFMARALPVDNFGSMSSLAAVLMDEAAFQVYDNLNEMSEFYNAKGLYWNYYWNHWQTYALSLLANAVALTTDATAPSAPVITEAEDGDPAIAGTGEAGAFIVVVVGGETYRGVVATGGAWSLDVDAVSTGDVITAYQIDAGGNKSTNATSTVVAGT